MTKKQQPSILLFEPENKGHHLQYLQYLLEDFKAGGFNVAVAFNKTDSVAYTRLESTHPGILDNIQQLDACCHDNKLKAAASCMKESGADELFMCCFDEVSSSLFRKASLGLRPPKALKGKISGIFIRPRPLDPAESPSLNLKFKRTGMNKLLKEGWFKNIFLLDEFLTADLQNQNLNAQFHFLPDVAEAPTRIISKEDARTELGIPTNKTVLLHYGTGTLRKGLPLALEAFKNASDPERFHLIVGGKQDESIQYLETMVNKKCATLINRFVSEEESDTLFAAADWILLPYIDHYGASNVLARAALANRPVIASDHHLLGRRVREYGTGLTFKNGDAADLKISFNQIIEMDPDTFSVGLKKYATAFTRSAFSEVLIRASSYP